MHIVSRKVYLLTFTALVALTLLTVWVAAFDLGRLNTVVALTIAFIKAGLVAMIFMHVRHSSRLTKVVVVGGLFWLMILFVLTISDYLTRGWLALSR